MELKYIATRAGRLSAILKEDMGLSTGLINKRKWSDRLFVNGVAVHTDHAVNVGDEITVPMDEEMPQYPAEEGPLTILFEDAHFLAVDKPAGMLIHPSRATMTGTLANRVLAYYQKTGQNCAFHPITRLDRDTFGVVLLAKNAHVHAKMNDLHAAGKLQKMYHALVWGGPEETVGEIDAPIDRRPLPSLLRYVNRGGKPSLTRYRVLHRRENCSLLALQPVTGRTHQLRVHCTHMGFPILGDPQYNTAESASFSTDLGLRYQCLCAKTLDFTHPITEERIQIKSAMEADQQLEFGQKA